MTFCVILLHFLLKSFQRCTMQWNYHFIFFYLTGHLLSSVVQTPADVIVRSGQAFTLSCSHNISSYNTILWYYQHEHGQGMHIIGYSFHGTHNLENVDDKKYKLVGDAKSSVNLTILELTLKESAVYFCAASAHSAVLPPMSPTKRPYLWCIFH